MTTRYVLFSGSSFSGRASLMRAVALATNAGKVVSYRESERFTVALPGGNEIEMRSTVWRSSVWGRALEEERRRDDHGEHEYLRKVNLLVWVVDSQSKVAAIGLRFYDRTICELREMGHSISKTILAFNKRDLPTALPVEELSELYAHVATVAFPTSAESHEGVEALSDAILRSVGDMPYLSRDKSDEGSLF